MSKEPGVFPDAVPSVLSAHPNPGLSSLRGSLRVGLEAGQARPGPIMSRSTHH